jgi:hypothetical protein
MVLLASGIVDERPRSRGRGRQYYSLLCFRIVDVGGGVGVWNLGGGLGSVGFGTLLGFEESHFLGPL